MEAGSSNGVEGSSSSDVGRFVSLTNAPEEQAAFFLEATNGNFDRAIEMFYGKISHPSFHCLRQSLGFCVPTQPELDVKVYLFQRSQGIACRIKSRHLYNFRYSGPAQDDMNIGVPLSDGLGLY